MSTTLGNNLKGHPVHTKYILRYLTRAEQEARGPQGLVSANMLSDNTAAFEEVIFNDETFGRL